MEDERIVLDWRYLDYESDRWGYERALYAIVHPRKNEILYLGKADGCTVRSRLKASDKEERVLLPIREQLGLSEYRFMVGEFRLNQRLTSQLICDIESLLIHQVDPWANTSNSKSRGLYSRRGMVVFCQGHWPLPRKTFRDE